MSAPIAAQIAAPPEPPPRSPPRANPTVSQVQARRVAPLWRRVGAWLVDLSLLSAVLAGFLFLALGMIQHGPPSRLSGLDWFAETTIAYAKLAAPMLGLFSILTVGYLALFTALGAQTPGKRVFGLEVIDTQGEEPGPLRSVLRAFFALMSGFLMLMGFLLVLFDRRHQALHDKLVGTYVVCRG